MRYLRLYKLADSFVSIVDAVFIVGARPKCFVTGESGK